MSDVSGRGRSGFGRYWTAAAISSYGTAVTAVAMPVLVVQLLGATPIEVGLVNAAQFIPYAALGLLVGVYVDRWPRRPVLVWASIGRATALGAIPLLWWLGLLTVPILVCLLLAFGVCAVFGFAATQSLLPRLVPRSAIVRANAQLDQAETSAQTVGPAVGGAVIAWLGAPITLVLDALSYLLEAVLVATLRIDEPAPSRERRSLRREMAEGLRWSYGHRVLGPLALSTHVWFVANGAAFTALAIVALRTLDFSALVFGLTLAGAGIAGFVGASLSTHLGARFGAGRVILGARLLYPLAWLLVFAALGSAWSTALVIAGLVLHGLAGGVENANEMGLRQTLTPDGLLGRANGTIRSVNRTMGALGALVGGVLLAWTGDETSLIAVIVLYVLAAALAARTAIRRAVVAD